MANPIRVAVTRAEYVKAPRLFEMAIESGLQCICVPHEDAACAAATRTHRARHVVLGADL